MSNKTERDAIGELLLREWGSFVEVLAQYGQTGTAYDPERWPQNSSLWSIDHGIRLLLEVAGHIELRDNRTGLPLDRAELHKQHQERAEYRRMYPGGMPSLTEPPEPAA